MVQVGGVINRADFNNTVNSVQNILGNGSGQDGYGQVVTSKETYSALTTNDLIDDNAWNSLRTDINKCSRHQSNNDALADALSGGIIGADASGPSVTRISGDTFSIDSPNNNLGVNDWQGALGVITTNKNLISSQQRTVTTTRALVNTTRNTSWGTAANSNVYCELQVEFTGGYATTNAAGQSVTASAADHARHFFNAGGEIHLTQFLSGSTAKDTDWGVMLGNAGITVFGSNATTGTGTANYRNGSTNVDGDLGGSIESALGFYQLTTGYQIIAKKNGSQAEYAENFYTLYAKRNSSYSEIFFKWEFFDADTGDQTGTGPGVDEPVLASGGQMGAGIDLLRPTGSYVSVPEPASTVITELRLT